jgi:hypothetical protein
MGRPQLGLPRLRIIKVRPARQYYSAYLKVAIGMMVGPRVT